MSATPIQAPEPPIQIEAFERLVYARRYEDSLNFLFGILISVKRNAGFSWFGNQPSLESLYTRLCAAITALIADPQFAFSYDGFCRLITDHATLHGLYKMSAFRSMDYALGLVGARNPENPAALQFQGEYAVPKLLMCWSLESDIDLDLEHMAESAPSWVAASLIGFLAIGGVHREHAYQRKVKLSKLHHLIAKAPLHDSLLLAVADTYMHCSYLDYPEKHELKYTLNKQLRALVLARMGAIQERHDLERKERPTIVVPIEWFGSHHAMYRCYAPSIRQLRTRFRVVGIGRPHEVDETAQAEFDKWITMGGEQDTSIARMISAIQEESPDIIFYPSIGMAAWWVAISNFSLAPIQVMCPGHPATSLSECIDYIISDGDLFGDESNYSEKCVHLPVGGARYIMRSGLDRSAISKPRDGVIRLAIPAMVMKLMPPFLRVVQQLYHRIKDEVGPVEVHFFPNQAATYNELIRGEMQGWVADAVVHPRNDYQPYMEALGRCDLMLSTFPFGGTNSTIDAMLAGVPVVTIEGDQIHSRSDASMIRRVGLPEWLITHTVDDYVAAVMRFVTDRKARLRVRRALERADIEALFYGDGPPEVANAFVNAMWGIYERELEKRAVPSGARDERAGDGPDFTWPILTA